jgi:hypothetical protein
VKQNSKIRVTVSLTLNGILLFIPVFRISWYGNACLSYWTLQTLNVAEPESWDREDRNCTQTFSGLLSLLEPWRYCWRRFVCFGYSTSCSGTLSQKIISGLQAKSCYVTGIILQSTRV